MVKFYFLMFATISFVIVLFSMKMITISEYFCASHHRNSKKNEIVTNLIQIKSKNSKFHIRFKQTKTHKKDDIDDSSKNLYSTDYRVKDPEELEWLDANEGKAFSNYGEDGCSQNVKVKDFYRIFKDWVAFANKHNITYFLVDGTLLGAWRNGDIVPEDVDMDIAVDINDIPKMERLQDKQPFSLYDRSRSYLRIQIDWKLPKKYRRRIDCDAQPTAMHKNACTFAFSVGRMISNRMHMDIFASITSFETVRIFDENSNELRKDDVYPLRRCIFMGMQTFCPQNTKKVLMNTYKGLLSPLNICKDGKWTHIFIKKGGGNKLRAN